MLASARLSSCRLLEPSLIRACRLMRHVVAVLVWRGVERDGVVVGRTCPQDPLPAAHDPVAAGARTSVDDVPHARDAQSGTGEQHGHHLRAVPTAARRKNAVTSSCEDRYGPAGIELRNRRPKDLVRTRPSRMATTPRSEVDRISRPTPCRSLMIASGTATVVNGFSPRAIAASNRAPASGCVGTSNGRRQITNS